MGTVRDACSSPRVPGHDPLKPLRFMLERESVSEDKVHCAINATVLMHLFRTGALHAEHLQCLDDGSKQMLRQIVVCSCQRRLA